MARVKHFKLKESDAKQLLLGWTGADGCFATDKIVVDGKKIGEMYREEPLNQFDSGWRFKEGSESTGYLNNPENAGAYRLNYICNCDPSIIPHLYAPYGSAFRKNRDGVFEKFEE